MTCPPHLRRVRARILQLEDDDDDEEEAILDAAIHPFLVCWVLIFGHFCDAKRQFRREETFSLFFQSIRKSWRKWSKYARAEKKNPPPIVRLKKKKKLKRNVWPESGVEIPKRPFLWVLKKNFPSFFLAPSQCWIGKKWQEERYTFGASETFIHCTDSKVDTKRCFNWNLQSTEGN